MAFSSTITRKVKNTIGDRKIVYGTYSNGSGDTGGDIDTGLKVCEFLMLQPTGSAVSSNQAVVNETFPCDGSAVTVVTDDNEDGVWIAYGY